MLGIGAAEDIAKCVIAQQGCHIAPDRRKVGDDAVVHEDVAAEYEGVAVDLGHYTSTGCTDVGKETECFGVAAETAEVEVVDGRMLGLIQSWSWTIHTLQIVPSCSGIPGNSEPIHVEKAVAHPEELVWGIVELVLLSMRK